ncbi:hypothetical protein TSOC_009517 [Tetrabaena socialis]|uniref:SET domain-containing protein n=1 Tax=Tetrabaena socialis TaxID=47790 RepID=A0A2J7ZVR1_9CHLO|nr:hypothetical protein TSOC_009517 [Tetrabaena socialis]|eukprot:PNH04328.1 hypothetical protein TSOC_009517 [Tetrabaena socialis]
MLLGGRLRPALAELQRSPGRSHSLSVTVFADAGGSAGLQPHELVLCKDRGGDGSSCRVFYRLSRIAGLCAQLGVQHGGAVALSVLPDGRVVAEAAAPADPSLVRLAEPGMRNGQAFVPRSLAVLLLGRGPAYSGLCGGGIAVRLLAVQGQADVAAEHGCGSCRSSTAPAQAASGASGRSTDGACSSAAHAGAGPPHGSHPALRPAASIAHLHGYVPSVPGLPPLSPGELRLCGLTLAPHVAAAVRVAGLDDLAAAAAAAAAPSAAAAASAPSAAPAPAAAPATAAAPSAAPWLAEFRRHGLDSGVLCWSVAEALGLTSAGGWDARLPEGPIVAAGVEVGPDPARGGLGLFATAPLRGNGLVGVPGGYVGVGEWFRAAGYQALPDAARAELRRCAEGAGAGSPAASGGVVEGRERLLWSFLVRAFSLPYRGVGTEDEAAAGSGGLPSPPLGLMMLGYGNLTALVNDPRDPLSGPWRERLQAGLPVGDAPVAADAVANCMVVPVVVRGLLLPVLVALRDIAPGEQLLRDYGDGWWGTRAQQWRVLDFLYRPADAAWLLHGGR